MKRIHAIIITALAVAGFCNIDGANAAPVIKMNCDHGVTAIYRQTMQIAESGLTVKSSAISVDGVDYSVGGETSRTQAKNPADGDVWMQSAVKASDHYQTATFAFSDAMHKQHKAVLFLMNVRDDTKKVYNCTWYNDQE